ncbi:MAG: hypothetical protein MI700_03575 [Balneolales bacterium]|nr:hypothetical protein [Balneolales bacterium]
MSRIQWSFEFFSRQGFKFLILELIIVFLGVYLAFVLQSYSENRKIDAEKERVMIGVKEDLEQFRFFFPGYASRDNLTEWDEQINDGRYPDLSNWRFIQPQYDYTAIEYALSSDASVIDFELNAALAGIYQELQKLQHVEVDLHEFAKRQTIVPEEIREEPLMIFELQNNFRDFRRFRNRYEDRADIMERIAQQSTNLLPAINSAFTNSQLRQIEIGLIQEYVSPSNQQEVDYYKQILRQFFPVLTEEDLNEALSR